MRMETFIRKQLNMRARWVPKVEEIPEEIVVWINRLGHRPLSCGRCGLMVRQVHSRGPWRHGTTSPSVRCRAGWRTAPSWSTVPPAGSGWNGYRGLRW